VPKGFPTVLNPLAASQGLDYQELLTASITIGLLGYLEMIAIGKSFILKNGGMAEVQLDPSQELRALGFGNLIGSFFQSFPNTGSFSKTAVNAASGVETPLGGVFTGLLVIFALLFLTPCFYWIPKAGLGAIIIMSVLLLCDFFVLIWRERMGVVVY
jgi:MFS superfamily sulfate permease-like transporter